MNTNIQLFPTSGLIEGGSTGSANFNVAVLCGVANGSVIIPVAVSGNGVLLTSA